MYRFATLVMSLTAQPVDPPPQPAKSSTELIADFTKRFCIVDTDDKNKSSSLTNLGVSRSAYCDCVVKEVSYTFFDETINRRLLAAFLKAMSSNFEQSSPDEKSAYDQWSNRYGEASYFCVKKLAQN